MSSILPLTGGRESPPVLNNNIFLRKKRNSRKRKAISIFGIKKSQKTFARFLAMRDDMGNADNVDIYVT